MLIQAYKADLIDDTGLLRLLDTLRKLSQRKARSSKDDRPSHFTTYYVGTPSTSNSNAWSEAEFVERFRFTKADIPLLVDGFGLPSIITTRRGYKMPRYEAMCVVLRRLSQKDSWPMVKDTFPDRRLSLLKNVYYHVIDHIYDRFRHLLDFDHSLWPQDLHYWARKTHEKGCELPNVVMFVDGTNFTICRPPNIPQSTTDGFFSGHHRQFEMHTLMIASPDGIIRYMSPLTEGSCSDAGQALRWEMVDRLQPHLLPALPDEEAYHMYGDKGFGLSSCVYTPFSNPRDGSPLPNLHAWLNKVMSSERESIEHVVGKPKALFKNTYSMRIQDQTPAEVVVAAVILTNCYFCLHRHQAAYYFDVISPTLSSYLSGEPLPISDDRVQLESRIDVSGIGMDWQNIDP